MLYVLKYYAALLTVHGLKRYHKFIKEHFMFFFPL